MSRGATMPLRKQEAAIRTIIYPMPLQVVSPHRIDMSAVIEMIANKQRREALVMSITCDLMAHI